MNQQQYVQWPQNLVLLRMSANEGLPPLENTACPHSCCVYQHTLTKDTTSRPCLLKPCRDRPMGCTHARRGEEEDGKGGERPLNSLTLWYQICCANLDQ